MFDLGSQRDRLEAILAAADIQRAGFVQRVGQLIELAVDDLEIEAVANVQMTQLGGVTTQMDDIDAVVRR
jgi:hypothetical protein